MRTLNTRSIVFDAESLKSLANASSLSSIGKVGLDETKSALLADLKRSVETGQVDLAYNVLKQVEDKV